MDEPHAAHLRHETLQVMLDYDHATARFQEAVQADYRFAGMHCQNNLFDLDWRYLADDATVAYLMGA